MFSYCTLHDKDIIGTILAIRVIVWSQVGIEEHSAWGLMQSDETLCVGPFWNQLHLNLSFQALNERDTESRNREICLRIMLFWDSYTASRNKIIM